MDQRSRLLLLFAVSHACLGCKLSVHLPHPPAVFAATAPSHTARVQLPSSGFYGMNLTLIQQPNGVLIGKFYEESGVGAQFSCGFLLQSTGPLSPAGELPIITWWPDRELNGGNDDEVSRGTLFVQDGSVSLKLPKNAHGGCWNVEPELNQGQQFDIGTGNPHPEWKSLRIVASNKLEFHHRPDANDFTKAYILKGDTLALLDTSPQNGVWRHVQLITAEGPKGTGWVLDSGLLPFTVPTR